MRLQAVSSSGCRPWTLTAIAVLAFTVVTPLHAQTACKLLQPAELESVLSEWASGGKAKNFSGSAENSGGISTDVCSSEIVRPNGNLAVTVVVVKNYPMDGGDAIRIRNAALAREGQWKVNGARLEQKTVGAAMCTLYGRPSVPAHAVCAIPRGKGYVEVNVRAPTLKEIASMDAVGTLVQKANSRL